MKKIRNLALILISSFLLITVVSGVELANAQEQNNAEGEYIIPESGELSDVSIEAEGLNSFDDWSNNDTATFNFSEFQPASENSSGYGEYHFLMEDSDKCGRTFDCLVIVHDETDFRSDRAVNKGKFIQRGMLGDQEYGVFPINNAGEFAQLTSDTDPGGDGSGSGGDSGGSGDEQVGCDAGWGFSWVICGAIEIMQEFMDFMKSVLHSLLTMSPLERNDGDGDRTAVYTVWSNIRNIANILLVPVFLFLIFAQATSFNVDTYTIKKMMPRLVAAVIFIQASFFLMALAVDITNVLGQGIEGIIEAPIRNEVVKIAGVGEDVTMNLIGVGLAVVSFTGLSFIAGGAIAWFLFLLPAIIAIVITFFTLVLRQIIIITLAVLSPIAFLLWVLPNTEKWFKQWLDMLIKALLMYPLIIALMSAGSLVAVIASNMDGNEVEQGVGSLIAFIAIIAPLFVIPLTYKVAGMAVSVIGGTLSKLSNKAAYGSDGKGGAAKPARERKEQRRIDRAAGIEPENWLGKKMMRSPGLGKATTIGSRRGLGYGKYAASRAHEDFRKQLGQAGKELDDSQIDDPFVLNQMSQKWGDRDDAEERIKDFEKTEGKSQQQIEEDQDKAQRLRRVLKFAGRNEIQAAALKRVSDMGEGEQQSYDDVRGAFKGDPQLGQQIVNSAAQAAGKKGRPDIKAINTRKPGETVQQASDRAAQGLSMEDWESVKPTVFKPDENGNVYDAQGNPNTAFVESVARMRDTKEGEQTLHKLVSKDSGLSAEKRKLISKAAGLPGNAGEPPPSKQDLTHLGGTPIEGVAQEDTQGSVPVNLKGGPRIGGGAGGGGGANPPPQNPPAGGGAQGGGNNPGFRAGPADPAEPNYRYRDDAGNEQPITEGQANVLRRSGREDRIIDEPPQGPQQTNNTDGENWVRNPDGSWTPKQ